MQAKLGIFTPKGQVLCYDCHGNDFPNTSYTDEEFEKFEESVHLRAGNYYTKCDKCRGFLQITDSVANEKNLEYELREMGYDAEFQQTGGMNSACILYIRDETVSHPFDEEIEEEGIFPPMYYVTYNFDGDNEFYICGFDKYNDEIEGTEFSFETYEEILNYIKSLTNLVMR